MRAMATLRRLGPLLGLVLAVSGCDLAGLASAHDTEKLHAQAQAALTRWADAVAAAGGQQHFVQVGEKTGQIGDWEEAVGDNNKQALIAGLVEAVPNVSAEVPADGKLQRSDGSTETFRLISARQALSEIRAGGEGDCPKCQPLQVIAAKLTKGNVPTSRGLASAPVWVFTLKGTAVQLTRTAIAGGVSVAPPPSNEAPIGISIDSATGSAGGRQLSVSFTGAPDPASKACGEDYTAQGAESPTGVVVIVFRHPHALGEACTGVGATRTATVELAAPLGERAVLEVQRGMPVLLRLMP
jgi:hypothetical protein